MCIWEPNQDVCGPWVGCVWGSTRGNRAWESKWAARRNVNTAARIKKLKAKTFRRPQDKNRLPDSPVTESGSDLTKSPLFLWEAPQMPKNQDPHTIPVAEVVAPLKVSKVTLCTEDGPKQSREKEIKMLGLSPNLVRIIIQLTLE